MLDPSIIVVGALNSQTELETLSEAVRTATGPQDRFNIFLLELFSLIQNGYATERGKWLDTYRAEIKVYTGRSREPLAGPPRIWAAVSLTSDGRLLALLKSSDGYCGEPKDHWRRLAEAVDRHDNGKVEAWKR